MRLTCAPRVLWTRCVGMDICTGGWTVIVSVLSVKRASDVSVPMSFLVLCVVCVRVYVYMCVRV
jgi:hypothetical protein